MVASQWEGSLSSNPLINCHLKLKKLRKFLRTWNWNVFGDTNKLIDEITKSIENTENILHRHRTDDAENELAFLHSRLNSVLDDQQVFLAAKSHVKWAMDGDRNTKLFQAAVKVRRTLNNFKVSLVDGSISDDRTEIGNQAVSFFQELLGGFSDPPDANYFDEIFPMITKEDNDSFTRIPSSTEIWDAVRNLPKDSAAGADGFNGVFYQACWKIIGYDISEGVRFFFRGFRIPTAISATTLILIPKVRNATSLDQVRPISLCNFLHKIISKILNDRLRPMLSRIISEEQFGFIPGRSIHQCISLAHDLTADINHKVHGGNVMAKLDLSKAYDRLSWHFLIRAMKAMGFNDQCCDLVYRNISNIWYSIRVKGALFGHFKSNRGLRQGDPLSPTLFVIAMDMLSRKLNLAGKPGGGVMPFWSSLRAKEINHIFFADDILLFSNGGRTSFRNLLKVLSTFCRNSGQILQPSKCKVFFSTHIKDRRKDDIRTISGFSCGNFPIKYLGAPLFPGRARMSYFQGIIDTTQDRIGGWMKSYLSFAGRLTMIKSVLSSIPIHSLAALPVPKGTIDALERIFRGFLWNNKNLVKRHWVSWMDICNPMEAGGLGIRPLHQMLSGLRGKLAWSFLKNDSLWAANARSRFRISRKGSHLWNTISPYISGIALDCQWLIGNGATPVGIFCQNIAMPYPKRLKDIPIKEALVNPVHRRLLLHNVNPRFYASIQGNITDAGSDRLIWTPDPTGMVSLKGFIQSCSQPALKISKFASIWHHWIPLKVSCFLWKLLRDALPTDDRVHAIGIPFPSKCVCCNMPANESTDHLLFHSDLSSCVWNLICPIFRKKRPISAIEFIQVWGVGANFRRFYDCLAFGLAACGLWEVWKCRNERIHEGDYSPLKNWVLYRWAGILSENVGHLAASPFEATGVCNALRINAPVCRDFQIQWRRWSPSSSGNTCNFAFFNNGSSSSMAAIMRDRRGRFLFAMKITSVSKHFLKCLLQLLSELRNAGLTMSNIKSACSDICLMGNQSEVEWPLFHIKRKIARLCSDLALYRVCPAANRPADALCFNSVRSLNTKVIAELPLGVAIALSNDSQEAPCSFPDQRIFCSLVQ